MSDMQTNSNPKRRLRGALDIALLRNLGLSCLGLALISGAAAIAQPQSGAKARPDSDRGQSTRPEGEGRDGMRSGERRGPQGPDFSRVITWLQGQGIHELSELTPDRLDSLREAFRIEFGLPDPAEHLQQFIAFLAQNGVATTTDLRNLSTEQIQSLREQFMEQMRANHPQMGNRERGEGANAGPGGGRMREGDRQREGGPGGGGFGGEMLTHLADGLEAMGITNLSDVTVATIKTLHEQMRANRPENPQGNNRQRDPRATGDHPQGGHPQGGGPQGGREGQGPGPGDMLSRIVSWLGEQGITSLDELTPERIEELGEAFRAEMRERMGEGGQRPGGGDRPRNVQ